VLDYLGDRSIYDLFEERAGTYRDRTFLVFENSAGQVTEFTYGNFFELVERCAQGLNLAGVGQGDFVLAHLSNCPEFLMTFFAIAKLGAAMVPSNVANTSPEIQHLVNVSRPVLAVTEQRYLSTVVEGASASPRPVTIVVARGGTPGPGTFGDLLAVTGDSPRPRVSSDDLAELIFTSGTASKPKAVMLTQANCLQAGLHAVNCLWLDEGERCLTALPLFHVNAQALSLFAALTVGGTLILLEEFRASKFWAQVRRHQATQTCVVAMQLRTVLAQPADAGDRDHRVRRLFYAINVSDAEKESFEERFNVTLINGYGCSETMTLLACSPVLGSRRWPSVGRPAVGRRILLITEDGREAAVGEVGEVVVEGTPGRDIMLGYYGDLAETQKALRDGRFYTGDNAYADQAGFLFFVDRKKNMIKRAGENISAAEVEAVIVEHPAVLEVCVLGVPDDIRDEAVVAVVVAEKSSGLTSDEVVDYCASRLSKFKVPSVVLFVDELPKTSIGKIQRDQIIKRVGELMGQGASNG
jgi:crotonobetaine/carnitine-CoA ligase